MTNTLETNINIIIHQSKTNNSQLAICNTADDRLKRKILQGSRLGMYVNVVVEDMLYMVIRARVGTKGKFKDRPISKGPSPLKKIFHGTYEFPDCACAK